MKKRTSLILGAILILLSGAVFAHDTLKQKVSWSPETLNLPSLKPGESTIKTVTLMNSSIFANQKINGEHLTFQTTSGEGTSIIATANFPKKFEPGQEVNVTLTFSVASNTPALPPRVIAGKVQMVKNENEKKLFEKPLLVNIAVSSISLPPFPDPALNNATLLGIDSDANGVRDDIDWYVVTAHPESAKIREALKQEARALTPFLRDADDAEKTRANGLETSKGHDCSYYIAGLSVEASMTIRAPFFIQFMNTKARSKAYWNANQKLGGTTSPRGPVLGSEWEAYHKAACTPEVLSAPN